MIAAPLAAQVAIAGVVAADVAGQIDEIDSRYQRADLVAIASADATSAAPAGFTADAPSRVASLPGVRAASGALTATDLTLVGPTGKHIGPVELSTIPVNPAIHSQAMTAGRTPRGDGEAVLDEETASRNGLHLGDRIMAGRDHTAQPLTLVGTVPASSLIYAREVSQLRLTPADSLTVSGAKRFDTVIVAADDQTDPGTLLPRVRSALGAPALVLRQSEYLDRKADEVVAANDLDELLPLQLILAGVAILAAAPCLAWTLRTVAANRRDTPWPLRSRLSFSALLGTTSLIIGSALGVGCVVLAGSSIVPSDGSALSASALLAWRQLTPGLLAHLLAVVAGTAVAVGWHRRTTLADDADPQS